MPNCLTVTVVARHSLLVELQDSRLFSQDFQYKFVWDAEDKTVADGTERIVLSPTIFSDVPSHAMLISPSLMQTLHHLGISSVERDGETISTNLGSPLGMGSPVHFRLLDASAITLPNGDKRSLSVKFSLMPYNGAVLNVGTCSLDRKIVTSAESNLAAEALCAVDMRKIAKFMSQFSCSPPELPPLYYIPESEHEDVKVKMSVALPSNRKNGRENSDVTADVTWDPLSEECEVSERTFQVLEEADISKLVLLMQKMEAPGWGDKLKSFAENINY